MTINIDTFCVQPHAFGCFGKGTGSLNLWKHVDIEQYWKVLCVPLTLTLALGVLGISVPSHTAVGEIAFLQGFPGDRDAWEINPVDALPVFNNGITVENNSTDRYRITHSTNIKDLNESFVQLRASIEILEGYKTARASAALALWFVSANGEWLGYQNVFFMPNRYAQAKIWRVAAVPEAAEQVVVGLISQPEAATYRVFDVKLKSVVESTVYNALVLLLSAAWLLYAFIVGVFIFKHSNSLVFLILFLLLLLLLLATINSADSIAEHAQPLLLTLEQYIGQARHVWLSMMMKMGHISGFFLLTTIAIYVFRQTEKSDGLAVLLMVVLAIATELAQLHVPDRQASFIDIIIDSVGIIVGWWSMSLVRPRKHRTDVN